MIMMLRKQIVDSAGRRQKNANKKETTRGARNGMGYLICCIVSYVRHANARLAVVIVSMLAVVEAIDNKKKLKE